MSGDRLGTLIQLVGLACFVFAAFLVWVPAGFVVLGLALMPVGHALDGTLVRIPARGRKLKKVA